MNHWLIDSQFNTSGNESKYLLVMFICETIKSFNVYSKYKQICEKYLNYIVRKYIYVAMVHIVYHEINMTFQNHSSLTLALSNISLITNLSKKHSTSNSGK